MTDGPPRWPHDLFRERLRPIRDVPRPRLRALQVRAARLQRKIEQIFWGVARSARGPRILVVEDDHATRHALAAILTRLGWEVAIAGTVADGLAALEPPPDCVFLDLMLPDGDGVSILKAARSSGLPTRFVVTTGINDPARLCVVASLRPDSLLQKPVSLDELCRACRNLP